MEIKGQRNEDRERERERWIRNESRRDVGKVRERKHIKTAAWERVQGARWEKTEVDILHPTCIITFHHPPLHRKGEK